MGDGVRGDVKLRTYPTSSIASVLYQKNTLRDGGVTRTGGRWGEGTIYTGVYTRMRDALEFEWDIEKAAANLIKHGIDFDDAIEIFTGPYLSLVLIEMARFVSPLWG